MGVGVAGKICTGVVVGGERERECVRKIRGWVVLRAAHEGDGDEREAQMEIWGKGPRASYLVI